MVHLSTGLLFRYSSVFSTFSHDQGISSSILSCIHQDLHLRVEGISLHAAAHAVRLEYVWGFPSGQTSSVSAMGTAEDRAKSPSSLLSEGSDALHSGFGHPLFTSLGNPTGVQVRVLRWLEGTRDWKRRVQVSVDELELQMPSLEMNAGSVCSVLFDQFVLHPFLSLLPFTNDCGAVIFMRIDGVLLVLL